MSSLLDDALAYVGLGEYDCAQLRALHPILAPHFESIARKFYEIALAHPEAAAVISPPAAVEPLVRTLVDWMSTGLLGPYDRTFYEKRSRIGRRHVEIGLPLRYMVTAMGVVRTEYQDRINLLIPAEAVRARTARAADKLLEVELAIMLEDYELAAERELVERERRIQGERLAAMQTLATGLAHEVRNPLNAARLQLELLERRLRQEGVAAKLLEPGELARREIDRLADLLDDFLSFTRPPELHVAEHDVVAVVAEVVAGERALAQRRGAELTLEAPLSLVAEIDTLKIHQIVQNLVRNALEAVAPGGHVGVAIDAHGGTVRVRVDDDGPGMPEAIRARVFEPFFSTKEAGTGLGMSIVHSLVALHAGTIELQSDPHGTHVAVVLPRRHGA